MAFCSKCGTQVNDDMKFCPSCGGAVGQPTAQQAAPSPQGESFHQTTTQKDFAARVQEFSDTTDTTNEYFIDDIRQNKGMAILSYLGLLVLVPILGAPRSPYARYHANQGLILLISEIIYGFAYNLVTAVLRAIFHMSWNYNIWGGYGPIYDVLTAILGLAWIVFTVFAILGIVNAAQGKAKELPLIGRFRLIK